MIRFFGLGTGLPVIPAYLWTLPVLVLLAFLLRDALRERRRKPGQRGPDLVVTAVIVCILAVSAYGSVSAWFGSKEFLDEIRLRNEADAMYVVQHIRDQVDKYYKLRGGYPGSLQELVTEGLLPAEWASEVVHGYSFEYLGEKPVPNVGSSGNRYTKFFLIAKPGGSYSGERVFFLEESGKIRIYESAKPDAPELYTLEAPAGWGTQNESSIEPKQSQRR